MTTFTNYIGVATAFKVSPLIWSQVAALEKTIDSRSLDIQILERRVSLLTIQPLNQFLMTVHTSRIDIQLAAQAKEKDKDIETAIESHVGGEIFISNTFTFYSLSSSANPEAIL